MSETISTKRGRKPGQLTFTQRIEAEGGDAVVFQEIAAGKTIREVMAARGYERDQWYCWIQAGGEARRAAWEQAKLASADALVEQAGEILDQAAEVTNSARATIAKERAAYRRWLASCRDQEAYGDRAGGAQVVLNIGQLHLDALRRCGSMSLRPKAPPLDAEIIGGGDL